MMPDPIPADSGNKLSEPPQIRLERLHRACVDFESMLIQQMFQSMQDTLKEGGLVGGGLSGNVYSSILTQAVAKSMAESQGVGLSNQLFKDMIKNDAELKSFYENTQPTGNNQKTMSSDYSSTIDPTINGGGTELSENAGEIKLRRFHVPPSAPFLPPL